MPKAEPTRPSKVLILGRPYTITWVGEKAWNELGPNGDGAQGLCENGAHEIYIRTYAGRTDGNPSSVSTLQDTLMHEILHALLYLRVAHKFLEDPKLLKAQAKAATRGVEEWLCDNLSLPLIQLVADNQAVFEWLTWKEL